MPFPKSSTSAGESCDPKTPAADKLCGNETCPAFGRDRVQNVSTTRVEFRGFGRTPVNDRAVLTL